MKHTHLGLGEAILETVKVIKMDATLPLYVLNVIIIVGMFIVTIYRAWIEKQNLRDRKKIEMLKAVLEKEADTIKGLSGEELIDMLKTVLKD